MNNTTQNLKAGFLFLLFMGLMLGATLMVKGGLKGLFPEGRFLTARFDSVENLSVSDKVYFAGVPVGKVTKIEFQPRWVDVKMMVTEPNVTIYNGCEIIVEDLSTLGGKQVSITRGDPSRGEIDWKTVIEGKAQPTLSKSVQEATGSFSAYLDENRETFNAIMENIEKATKNFEEVSTKLNSGDGTIPRLLNDKDLYDNVNKTADNMGIVLQNIIDGKGTLGRLANDTDIFDNLNFITEQMVKGKGLIGQMLTNEALYNELEGIAINIEHITRSVDDGKGTLGRLVNDPSLYDNLDQIVGRINSGEGTLGRLLSDDFMYTEINEVVANLKDATRNLTSITEKIDSGRGSVGKLVNDTSLVDKTETAVDNANDILSAFKKFKTYIGGSMKYLGKQQMTVGRIYIRVEVSKSKYLIVGGSWLGLQPEGQVLYEGQFDGDKGDDMYFQPEIQLGFKYFDNVLGLRLGLLEGQFGGAVDVDIPLTFLFDSQLRFTLEGRVAFSDSDFDGTEINEDVSPFVMRFEASLFLFDHVRLFAGAHNLFDSIGFTGGIAFEYHDDDIRNLVGYLGLAS